MADSKCCARCKTWRPVSDFSRQASRADGLHPWCKTCQKDYNREYLNDPGNHARHLAWRRVNESYDRSQRAQYLYGVSVSDLLAAQDGRCAICGTDDAGGRWKTWHVDHDSTCCPRKRQRTCGACVRGLLCSSCNLMLGHAKDSPERLRAAAEYVERTRNLV
jgi:hypothetical protein